MIRSALKRAYHNRHTVRSREAARDLAIRTGLRPYIGYQWPDSQWEDYFAKGLHARFHQITQQARYSVLIGYLPYLTAKPDVLDVGCGDGLLRARLPDDSFSSYLGIDPTSEAVRQARERVQDERTRFAVCDPFDEALRPADIVFCAEVIYQAPDPFALIERLGDLVRPGGHLLTSMWRHPGDVLLWGALDRRLERVDRVAVRTVDYPRSPRGWIIGCHQRHHESSTGFDRHAS